jgi:hypothetical protein
MVRRWGLPVLALLAALLAAAAARWLPAKAVVAHLNSDAVRRQWGVERAERDPRAPERLVIRVSGHWYDVPAHGRSVKATGWLEDWRRSVAGGVVSVLDARTDLPVVQFGTDGRVAGVTDRPPH